MNPDTGDMVLCQGVDTVTGEGMLFSKITAHCQRNVEENYTDEEATWTHAGMMQHFGLDSSSGRSHRVVESRGLGVTKKWYDKEPRRWVVLRHPCVIDQRDRIRLLDAMDDMVGDPYGWRDVALLVVRHWCHRLSSMPFDSEGKEFCSEALARAYLLAGIPLPSGVLPSAMWPAEIARMWRNGALECVYDSKNITITKEGSNGS